jgi:hypothetical protein
MTNLTSATIMDAIFALDAYNHKPDDGSWSDGLRLLFPNLVDGQLGDYTLSDASSSAENSNHNFFAIAYSSATGTVISYRGTTDLSMDIVNGYGLGAGSPSGPDATDAVAFYQRVAGPNDTNWPGAANITVVGHSLGGGLAGFVGAIYGLQGVLFDNMTFNNAAFNAYSQSLPSTNNGDAADGGVIPGDAALSAQIYGTLSPYPNDLSGLSAYATTGELLSVILPLRFLQTPSVQYLDSYGGLRGIIDLHSMSLLTLLIYAQANNETTWQSVGKSFVDALFNDRLAAAIVGNGGNAALMRDIIAYSAITSGYQPFGDTGVQSLFSDADALGDMVSNNKLGGVLSSISVTNALAEILVQYAGDQAAQDQTDLNFASGALASDGRTLKVDLDPTHWISTYEKGTGDIIGVDDFGAALWQQIIADNVSLSSGDGAVGVVLESLTGKVNDLVSARGITEILAAIASGADLDGTNAPLASNGETGEAIIVGSNGNGTLTAGDANNLIIGGAKVTVGNGDNIIVGESGAETFQLGLGNNTLVESGGHATVDYGNLDLSGSPSSFVLSAGASGAVLVSKTAQGESGGSGTPKPPGTDYLYNVENFKFGTGADYVTVLPGTDLTKIKSMDDGDNPDGTKDVLDFSNMTAC